MAKLKVVAENPPRAQGSVEQQVSALREYIFRLQTELEWVLTHLDEDNFSERMKKRLEENE